MLPGMKLQEANVVSNLMLEHSTQSLGVKWTDPVCSPEISSLCLLVTHQKQKGKQFLKTKFLTKRIVR